MAGVFVGHFFVPMTDQLEQRERDRLAALHSFSILDSIPEQGFDDIVELAAMVCDTPVAQISFIDVDRQWIKASIGIPAQEAPRAYSFCAHTLVSGQPVLVPDAKQDPRFQDNPLVLGDPQIRSYAGAPIIDAQGHVLGTVCVIDTQPRALEPRQISALQALARQVVTLLEQRQSLLLQTLEAEAKNQSNQISLQQTAERLRLSQVAGKIASWDWDLRTDELTWSGGSEWVYGRPASEVRTIAQITSMLHADDVEQAIASMRPLLDGSGEYRSEFRVWWPDGSLHWLLGFGQPVLGADGTPVRVVGMNMDITDRKQAQENLIRSEKVATVGRLITSIAHEINNPMASVTNLLFLARDSENVPEIREYLSLAEQELQRVSEIVNQTLRFHRQPAHPQPASLQQMIGGVLNMLQSRVHKAGVLVKRRDRTQKPVVCFEGELRQVMANLIGNAIDATPLQGSLFVRTREGQHVPSGRQGVFLTVADTGHGMSQETLGKIFQAFFTTKGVGGTGLGLWVTCEILVRHFAVLRVRSSQRPGRSGTVFSVFLPSNGSPA